MKNLYLLPYLKSKSRNGSNQKESKNKINNTKQDKNTEDKKVNIKYIFLC